MLTNLMSYKKILCILQLFEEKPILLESSASLLFIL